ncbi:MAG: hypothetical protein E3J45_00715 [Candidatus Zixiibacteriota bacterium]|nr:MAG: hypothetical protein E3J45_00715 [candidate division Zixibacteria bacterium]
MSNKVKEKADFSLSFSKMTTSHQLLLLLILEQLFRALDLSTGGKYHKQTRLYSSSIVSRMPFTNL